MNMVLKVLAVLLGICMILPGLCTVLFGGYFGLFALSNGGRDAYGIGTIGLPMLIVGGLVTWLGVMILIWTFRRRD